MRFRQLTCAVAVLIAVVSPANSYADEPLCVGDQLNTAKAAMKKAKGALDKAIAAIDSKDDATSRKLIEWFGARSSADGGKVRQVLVGSRVFADGAVYLCAIKSDVRLGEYYAYVRPDKAFVITLGNFFFSASDSGFSSKLGTLIHEMTHFTVVGAAKDPKIYGVDEAKALARTNPDEAMKNAENIEYFVEAIYFGL